MNQTVKTTTANRHKRLNQVAETSVSKKRKTLDSSKDNNTATTPIDLESSIADPEQPAPGYDASLDDQNNGQSKSLQILDFSSGNPIVAYGAEVFSCKWTDMIGTTMFLAQPQEIPFYDSELSTADYEMIGTSRIKLVGTRTKVIPIQQSSNGDSSLRSGQSLGTIRRNHAKVNADLRKQASFLEQLMNIKKDRGEIDNVFVAMNDDIAAAITAGRLETTARTQAKKIENLNREAVKGSAEALQQIEQIYLDQNGNDIDEDPTFLTTQQPQVEEIDSDAEHDIDDRPRVLGTINPSPGVLGVTAAAAYQQDPANVNKDDG